MYLSMVSMKTRSVHRPAKHLSTEHWQLSVLVVSTQDTAGEVQEFTTE